MTPEQWLTDLQGALPEEVALDSAERVALLDLARVAAHTSERWTAPISTYLVGLALADVDPAERAARIEALVERLEP